jgi:hypothetical protein
MDGAEGEIARLEAQIEALAHTIAGCRKIMAVSQLAMAAGGLWLAAPLFDLLRFEPLHMIAALSALMGGIVAFGSNTATVRESEARLREAEARRAELIDRLHLQPVAILDADGPVAG